MSNYHQLLRFQRELVEAERIRDQLWAENLREAIREITEPMDRQLAALVECARNATH